MKIPTLSALLVMTAAPVMLLASPAGDHQIDAAAKNSFGLRVILQNQVTAETSDGVVTLTGTVPENDLKAFAQDVVAALPGVTKVNNEIKAESEPARGSDAWIAAKLPSLLLMRTNVRIVGAKVDVKDGVAMVSGMVDNMDQRDVLENYAREVQGVKQVGNATGINPKPAPKATEAIDDASISAMVKYVVIAHPITGGVKSKVVTTGGVVVITASVKTSAEKDVTEVLAKSVNGVKSLTSNIAIN